MHLFSVFLLILTINKFLKSKNLKSIFLFLFTLSCILSINRIKGYFCKIGNVELSYDEFTIGLSSIVALMCICKIKLNRRMLITALLLITVIVMGISFTLLFPIKIPILNYAHSTWELYSEGRYHKERIEITIKTVMIFVRIIIFIILLFVVRDIVTKEKIKGISKWIILSIKFHICFLLFEYIMKNFFRSNITDFITKSIFGEGEYTYNLLIMRGNTYALYGLTREPSHVVFVLFEFMIILILTNKLLKNKIWVLLSLILMALSGAFTTFYSLAIIVLVYMYYLWIKKKNETLLLKIIFLSIIGLAVCMIVLKSNSLYLERVEILFSQLQRFFGGKTAMASTLNTSEGVRLTSIFDTIQIICRRPLLGVGVGVTNCYSGIVSSLAGCGIIGFILWAKLFYIDFPLSYDISVRGKNVVVLAFLALGVINIFSGMYEMMYKTQDIYIMILCICCIQKNIDCEVLNG